MKKKVKESKKLLAILSLAIVLIGSVGIKLPVHAAEDSKIGAFIVVLSNGESTVMTNAFCVEDTYGSEKTFCVTDSYVAQLVEQGFEAQLLQQDYQKEVTEVISDGRFAYIRAEGLKKFTPFSIAREADLGNVGFVSVGINEEKGFYLALEKADFSEYQYNEGLYVSADASSVEDALYLGLPVVDFDTVEIFGMTKMAEDGTLAVMDINLAAFPEEMAVTSLDPKLIVAAVIILVVIGLFLRKSTSKKNGNREESKSKNEEDGIAPEYREGGQYQEGNTEAYAEGTIPLTPEAERGRTEMVQVTPEQEPIYQIRGIGGAFDGQVFGINTSVLIGRSPECKIQYQPKTAGISGKHCQIEPDMNGIVIRDLNSSYGTYFNGTHMNPQIPYYLKAGDQFYLGEKAQSFRVEKAGETRQTFSPVVKALVEPKAGAFYRANAEGKIGFGRSANSQVKFDENDTSISTRHCVLYKTEKGLFLMDLGSTNGTFLREDLRLRANEAYKIEKGSSFFLASPKYTFVVTED